MPTPVPGPPVAGYVDVAREAGIDVLDVCGDPARQNVLLDTLGQGAAIFDYDGDGLFDVFIVNGSRREGPPELGDRLYRNRGGLRFDDVTAAAGIRDLAWGVGAAVGDCDNDGDADLFVANHGPNALWRNLGNGTFADESAASGLADERTSTGAGFGDFDGDGLLDLYVASYVQTDLDKPGEREDWRGIDAIKGPRGLVPEPDLIYRNLGNCRFREQSAEWLPPRLRPQYGLGVLTIDFDHDGDTDILVANDSTPNFVLRNKGTGEFEEVGMLTGFALSEDGRVQGCMGIDGGDVNGDGREDVIITNFSLDYFTLYLNKPEGFFDVSGPWGLGFATRTRLGWGTVIFDHDHDGDPDVLFANGHVYAGVDRVGYLAYKELNQLFENVGDQLVDVSHRAGPAFATPWSARGMAAGDLDNDGRLEFVIVNIHDRPSLLVDRAPRRGNGVGLELTGLRGNRDAIGARVTLKGAGRSQVRELRTSGSYAAARDKRLLFGLGQDPAAQDVSVLWPGGRVQALGRLEGGCYWRVREGEAPVRAAAR
jgi:hypothetical protein